MPAERRASWLLWPTYVAALACASSMAGIYTEALRYTGAPKWSETKPILEMVMVVSLGISAIGANVYPRTRFLVGWLLAMTLCLELVSPAIFRRRPGPERPFNLWTDLFDSSNIRE